jgi:hypothetical protein
MRISALLLALMILVPTTSVLSEPAQREQRDVPREMDEARDKLRDARHDLENAGTEWGGHRARAIEHIDKALRELEEAEHWAREHREYRERR